MKIPNPLKPDPAPPSFGEGKVLPEESASILSRLVFHWLGPFLHVGFSRPLEKEDFWELPNSSLTKTITDQVESNFFKRCPPEKRPHFMRSKDEKMDGESEDFSEIEAEKELQPEEKLDSPKLALPDKQKIKATTAAKPKSKYDESLFKAIHRTFIGRIWVAGLMKLISDTLKTTTPLLNKVILNWLAQSYAYSRVPESERASLGLAKPKGIGYGIGLAVALFVMQEAASLMTNIYQQTSLTTGLVVRTGIIGSVFRKSLRLSGRARVEHSIGQITTMISTDATRLDRFSAFGHNIWVAPIQLAIGVGLLIGNLGYSALVGLAILLLSIPLQIIPVRIMMHQRKKAAQITDKRVRMITEVLQGIRLIKVYAWERFFVQEIGEFRVKELRAVGNIATARSLLIAVAIFTPVLASVLSFVTYALSGHDLNVAIIFTSLQLFNVIRTPLLFLPFVLSALSDALIALGRISKYLLAEELAEPYKIDYAQKLAVDVDGDFIWETTSGPGKSLKKSAGGVVSKGKDGTAQKGGNGSRKVTRKWWGSKSHNVGENILPTMNNAPTSQPTEKEEEKPFELNDLKLSIPKGAFIGIVGRVGTGKSSVLQALIGEMRRTRGQVVLGGTMAYVPQSAWIRNATLRQNILFGQEDDEERFRQVVHACSLSHDLETLPYGENTEIGEKGINLSGGQKARVSLARAAYSQSDIVLLDDPLSAVDAYVGKAILENCLLNGPLADRTRILVTHALHVLDKTDYIYVMDHGAIIEQGTYKDLMADSKVFSRLIEEYGSLENDEDLDGGREQKKKEGDLASNNVAVEESSKKSKIQLMQAEERNTGAVTWTVYHKYMRFAGGLIWIPVILFLLTITQGAQVANNLFLGFWTDESIPGFSQGQYMAVYAGLGVAQAIFSFFTSLSFVAVSLIASLRLFRAALSGVLHLPASFFDTTPMGRILSRLSKDQDTLDAELALTLWQMLFTFSSVVGTVALVFYTFPLLGIIFFPMSILYYLVALYYRRSSVETKRLDSLLRSTLYGSYSETLTGLSTIRAYQEQDRAIADTERGLDLENRAYYMTISIQRWLAVRLDVFGNILLFGIGLFAAGFRESVNPAKIGVVLSYTLSITQVFSDLVSQFAQNEQNMNAVERVLHYTELPCEGDTVTPNDPPQTWPSRGEVNFTNVELAYRPGLPLVLKDISFNIKPGEKIGIVGRTGAGKSSLLQALFRMVELQSGKIEIDGVNIRNIGLDVLRGRLALVPQDTTLFLGTLRHNLDPRNALTDAELISLLQRVWLLPRDGVSDPAAEAKFSLDSVVSDEGSNYSAGEKQLLALCRALVKNSRIIILDEATSNVDVETDAKLQRTIQIEFNTSTLLCIAHRLNTIAYYDRVIVMEAGKIAEFDTVLNLFDREDSIFRSLCDEANLSRSDIERIRADHDTIVKA